MGSPRHDVRYSRWKAGPTTFGPTGRMVATALVAALGPWTVFGGLQLWNPFFLWYLMGYSIGATIVLKQIWLRVVVEEPSHGRSAAPSGILERRCPKLFTEVDPRVASAGIVALALGAALVGWSQGGSTRYAVVVLAALVGAGLLLGWLSGL